MELLKTADVYALTGTTGMRSRTMFLNGKELVLGENGKLSELIGVTMEDTLDISLGGCTFIVL